MAKQEKVYLKKKIGQVWQFAEVEKAKAGRLKAKNWKPATKEEYEAQTNRRA